MTETTVAKKGRRVNGGDSVGFVLFIAYFGAAVYFWHQASGFWGHVWALLKAAVWPAILVYHAFRSFGV